jgi:predicted Fe-S protein YdhL (DUF1289 family)|tara:strand:+ start:1291 stop:1563 length:273 start_codon:yes stop_codon:yes gene_type:complete
MSNQKIISPCISICKSDSKTGQCYGCARTDEEKKIWKNPNTKDEWKKENLDILLNRMSKTQLKTFQQSYKEKIEFGKMVYSKKLQEKPKD